MFLNKVSIKLSLLSLLCVALSSCALRPEPFPSIYGSEIAPSQKSTLLKKIEDRNINITSFRALARTTVSYGTKKDTFRNAIVARKPGDLRIETLPLNGVYTLGLLTVVGQHATVFDAQSKKESVSDDPKKLIQETTRIPLGPEDLLNLLSGNIPLGVIELAKTPSAHAFEAQDGTTQWVLGEYDYYFVTAAESGNLMYFEMRDPKSHHILVAVEYGNYEANKKIRLPSRITIRIPKDDVTIQMRMSFGKINGQVGDEVLLK